jgi:hypothetical protein
MRVLATAALFLAVVVSAGAQVQAGGLPALSVWERVAPDPFMQSHVMQSHGHAPHRRGASVIVAPWLAGYPEPPAAPVIVLQSPPAAPRPMAEVKPLEPLMIEWQGDHYARLTEAEMSARRSAAPLDYAGTPAAQPKNVSEATTLLVYRDGHRERVGSYSIVGTVLYASGDFYSNGSWTTKIPLSTLDLPATIKANSAAGVKFELPSGPNVVIARF